MSVATPKRRAKTAEHRPATRKRRFRHDELTAVDLFSGFGGLTKAVVDAGFTAIMAANHNRYKVDVHEANHPEAEHWIADLVDTDAADYHSAADLPGADLLTAGVSCVNHSQANTQRAYEQGADLFSMEDPERDARVTRSERDRATAFCVLQYAAKHHPRVILVECTTELQSWGPAVQGKAKVGDGSTYRWWLGEFEKLGYRYKVLFLNSQFFGVGQSRDRIYIAMWDKALPTPDLDHRPMSYCTFCSEVGEAQWAWKTGIPATGSVRYGKQYHYLCRRCHRAVVPPFTPSLDALDLTDLGTKIGDRAERGMRPLAAATLARAERCRQKFAEFPAVMMPAKAARGVERTPFQPMSTQTSQQETAILNAGGPLALAIDNFQGAPRGADEPLATQGGSETMALVTSGVIANRTHATPRPVDEPMQTVVGGAGSGGLSVVSAGVLPFRKNTLPTTHGEAMPTVTSEQVPGMLMAAGTIKNNGSIDEAKYRAHPVDKALGTIVGSATTQGLLMSGWFKQNGSTGFETAAHPATDPFGTLTSRDTTGMLHAQWTAQLDSLTLDDCYFRMMNEREIGRGCGFDVDFMDHKGTFKVWGSARDQVDGYGNAVSPQVGEWIATRLRAVLHAEVAA